MTCIACGSETQATVEMSGIEAAFCYRHIPFGTAKIKMFAVC